jgi:hypothetical protein
LIGISFNLQKALKAVEGKENEDVSVEKYLILLLCSEEMNAFDLFKVLCRVFINIEE